MLISSKPLIHQHIRNINNCLLDIHGNILYLYVSRMAVDERMKKEKMGHEAGNTRHFSISPRKTIVDNACISIPCCKPVWYWIENDPVQLYLATQRNECALVRIAYDRLKKKVAEIRPDLIAAAEKRKELRQAQARILAKLRETNKSQSGSNKKN
jgi:hypothetical protein